MDYVITKETYRRTASGVTVLAHLSGITALILLIVWLLHYHEGLDIDSPNAYRVFNVHPFLMFFGFIFLSGEAMMAYKTVRAERSVQKFVHMFLNLTSMCLGIVGVHAAFKFHDRQKLADMQSLHSWIGITTLCLFILQWLFGFSLYMFPKASMATRARFMPWHVCGGRALLYMAICAAETGLMEKVSFMAPGHHERYVINFLALTVLLFGVTVDLSVVLARYA